MQSLIKIIGLGVIIFQVGVFAKEATAHDLNTETHLLEQLAVPDTDTKINAAVEIGNIFRTQKGLHPQVYSRLLRMLSPESSPAEREGAAWALGEIRYVEPSVRKLMKQYEVEAVKAGDISLSTVLMHSLREIADVLPEPPSEKCKTLLKSLEH